jgi:hypothetical protein
MEEDISDINDFFHKGYECLYDYIDLNPSYILKDCLKKLTSTFINQGSAFVKNQNVFAKVSKYINLISFMVSSI